MNKYLSGIFSVLKNIIIRKRLACYFLALIQFVRKKATDVGGKISEKLQNRFSQNFPTCNYEGFKAFNLTSGNENLIQNIKHKIYKRKYI